MVSHSPNSHNVSLHLHCHAFQLPVALFLVLKVFSIVELWQFPCVRWVGTAMAVQNARFCGLSQWWAQCATIVHHPWLIL